MLKACAKCGRYHEASFNCKGSSGYRLPRTNEQALRNKHKWRKKSESVRESSLYLCAVCCELGDYREKPLEVHHIEKLKDAPELLLDDNNLISLCVEHHKLADAGKLDKDYLRKLAKRKEEENAGLFGEGIAPPMG